MNADGKLYLRNGTGKTFGPVDFSVLQKWVCDGRVEPTAMLSDDLENWVPAPNVPGLGMEWVVENNPGQFYGPTHRAVIDDFIRSGSLVSGARFYRDMRSGLAERAEREAAARAEREKTAAELKALQARAAETDSLRRAWAQAADAERHVVQERDALRDEVEALRLLGPQVNELKGRQAALVVELEGKSRLLIEAARQAEVSAKALDKAHAEIETLKAAHVAVAKAREAEAFKVAGVLKDLDATQAAIASLREAQEKATRDRDEIQRRLIGEQKAHERVQADLAAASRKAEQTLEELDSVKTQLAAIRKERDALKAELESLKEVPVKCADVVVPEVVIADEPPPKPARGFGRAAQASAPCGGLFGGKVSSLADLERQAQAELARMRATGGKGFFGFGKR